MPVVPTYALRSSTDSDEYAKKMDKLRRDAQKEAAPAPRQSASRKQPGTQLKSGQNQPKGTPAASDSGKAWAASQTRSTERKS
jgi:hypothetical protein